MCFYPIIQHTTYSTIVISNNSNNNSEITMTKSRFNSTITLSSPLASS